MAKSIVPSGYFGTGPENIHIIENFISNDLCDQIYEYCMNDNIWTKTKPNNHSVWDGRVLSPDVFANESFFNEIKELNDSVSKIIEKTFLVNTNTNGNLTSGISLVKWSKGDVQYPHGDKEDENGNPHQIEIQNHDIGSIFYLNDNYKGGDIYFTQHNITLSPKKGMLVFFPGDKYYLHGVKEIIEGYRFTMPRFWSVDRLL